MTDPADDLATLAAHEREVTVECDLCTCPAHVAAVTNCCHHVDLFCRHHSAELVTKMTIGYRIANSQPGRVGVLQCANCKAQHFTLDQFMHWANIPPQ